MSWHFGSDAEPSQEDFEGIEAKIRQEREKRLEWERKKATAPRCSLSELLREFQQMFPEDKELQELFYNHGWLK